MSQPKKKNFKIEPFKHKVEMDPRYPERTWKILEDAIHQIYNHNASNLSFEELYRSAYNMVLHKYGDKLYYGLLNTMTQHLQEIGRLIEAAQGGLFLEEMNSKWMEHNKALQMIRDILMYMDRTYVANYNKTPVHELGLNLWRDNIVRSPKIRDRLLDTLLDLVHRERTGEVINRGLMRNITKMLMDLGSTVYQEELESRSSLKHSDCADYLKKAERRLNEEIERVSQYLDTKSESKITAVVEKEMKFNHMKLLASQQFEMFMFCTFTRTGKQLVTDPERQKDPVDFVQRLLFISLFVDDKLRKGLKGVSEEDAETVLDKVMMLFRYLQEKDVFEKYYKQHLAKRLLSGRTVSDDAERSLIVKLKTECGYQFTSKLEGMFTDMKTSRDTMLGFNCGGDSNEGPALTVQVLTTGSWPTQSGAKCNLPTEILSVCDKFKAYYLSTHTGRRLTWQTNMGTADLKATFGSGQKHELNVSTYQMCILMLFNQTDSLSYKDIEQATDIPSLDLKRNLQSLACVKGKNILRKEPMSKDISEEDVFTYNDKFSSKFYKVKISTVVAQKESEPEKVETRQKVEEDRKPQIEAAIVRILKARRVLDHNNIVSEVTKQLQARFLPNPAVIKKRLESLIEREFLERDKIDRKVYRYLA
ncbi:hypothetical protein O6H91_12G104400 [Diphasiastrum complanatum]|uniref:Uncharacterized protein n=1 Tax=Diphasiastrum complanatum TaxID=34168 RepID=A0ACC2C5B5_DIPCM|nr:hypothetical protein O6H91_12G104400 [Diphasiastrum complanatum]